MVSTATFTDRRAVGETRLVGIGRAPLLWLLTALVIVAALTFGGGTRQGLWSNAVVELVGLALIGWVLPAVVREPACAQRWTLAIVVAVVVVPICQLVRLPPAMWTLLPGRAAIVAAYREAGVGLPWLPVSLDPAATWRSALSLLPAVAVYLATRHLGTRARRSLSLLLVAVGVASVMLGLAQLMQGPASALRLYPITNPTSSVGFFANRNHYAALLYCLIPFTAAWTIGALVDRRPGRALGLAVCVLVYAALVLGVGMALSRAGMVLAIAAGLASLALAVVRAQQRAGYGLLAIGAAILVGTILVVQFAFFGLLGRFGDDALAGYRFTIAATTVEAARAFQPAGSGMGTFVPVYQMFEIPGGLLPSYVNHAHDDWLEIWLEGGWLAIAVIAAFLVWFVAAAIRAWRAPPGRVHDVDRALARAASIAIVLLLLHSTVDYPLRTTALATVFAFCCALLSPPVAPAPGGVAAVEAGWRERPARRRDVRRGLATWRLRRPTRAWHVRRQPY